MSQTMSELAVPTMLIELAATSAAEKAVIANIFIVAGVCVRTLLYCMMGDLPCW